MTRIDPANIATLQALYTASANVRNAEARDHVRTAFRVAAADEIGEIDATQLLDTLDTTGGLVAECLCAVNDAYNCHVGIVELPGEDTRVVRVFADINDAYDWVNSAAVGHCRTERVEYVPAATPELPTALAAELTMLASDLARMFSDCGYADHGLDVAGSDILPHLPAFLAAVRANSQQDG